MSKSYRIALCQLMATEDKGQNHRRARGAAAEAARGGASVVCLPEIWNSPYDMKLVRGYAEPEDGPSTELMSELARAHGIYIIGGSIPELGPAEGNALCDAHNAQSAGNNGPAACERPKIYNTSLVFAPTGDLIAKHRKAHLYDVDIEKGVCFKESDYFAAGDGVTVFDTDYGVMGLAICFDVRFPEMFRGMAEAGAHIVFLPAQFNMTSGPAHWDILIKSRALDNQIYIAACGAARNLCSPYTSWGHSCVATPWGEYCAATDSHEAIVYADIDVDYMKKIRRELPIGN